MYCNQCGEEIHDTAVVCIKCGVPNTPLKQKNKQEGWNSAVMIGVCVGTLIIPLIGIVMGIVGLCKYEDKTQGGILLGLGVLMTLVNIGIMYG